MPSPAIAYLVFDIETVADGNLVSRLQYPGQGLEPAAAVARYRSELMARNGRATSFRTRFNIRWPSQWRS